MWVRGLKLQPFCTSQSAEAVAPYVGAWIETLPLDQTSGGSRVAPYVGAWIETFGLNVFYLRMGRTLCGCVD